MRRLRTVLAEQFEPPICARIKATREQLRREAIERGGLEAGREFTQERVAQKLHISLQGYRAYEKDREPNYQRRHEIAKALGLDPGYFEVAAPESGGADDRLREIVREELREVLGALERLERRLPPDDAGG